MVASVYITHVATNRQLRLITRYSGFPEMYLKSEVHISIIARLDSPNGAEFVAFRPFAIQFPWPLLHMQS